MRIFLICLLSAFQIILSPSIPCAQETLLAANLAAKLEAVIKWGVNGVKKPRDFTDADNFYEYNSNLSHELVIKKINSIKTQWRDEALTRHSLNEWNDAVSFYISNLKNVDLDLRLLSLRGLKEISRIEQRMAVYKFDGKIPSVLGLTNSILYSIHRELNQRGAMELDGWALISEEEDLIYELKDFYWDLFPYDINLDGIDDSKSYFFENSEECFEILEDAKIDSEDPCANILTKAINLTNCEDLNARQNGYDFIGKIGDCFAPLAITNLDVVTHALRLGMIREKFLYHIHNREELPYDSNLNEFARRIERENLSGQHIDSFNKALQSYRSIMPLDYDLSGVALDQNDIEYEIKREKKRIKNSIKLKCEAAIRDLELSKNRVEYANRTVQEIINKPQDFSDEEMAEVVSAFYDKLYTQISIYILEHPGYATEFISQFYSFLFLDLEGASNELVEILSSNEKLFVYSRRVTLSPSNLLKLELYGLQREIDLERMVQLNKDAIEIRGERIGSDPIDEVYKDSRLSLIYRELDKIGREFLIKNGQIYLLKNLTLNWILLQSLKESRLRLYFPGSAQIALWLEPALQEVQYRAEVQLNNLEEDSRVEVRKNFIGELLTASKELKSLSVKSSGAKSEDDSYLRSVRNALLFKYPILSTIIGNKDGGEFDSADVKTELFSTYKEPLFLWEKIAEESSLEESLTYAQKSIDESRNDKWQKLLDRAIGIQEEGMRRTAELVSLGIDREVSVTSLPFQKIVRYDDQFKQFDNINNRILEEVTKMENSPLLLDRLVGISSFIFLGATVICPAFMPVWIVGLFLLDVVDYKSTQKKGDIYQKEYLRFISNVTGSEVQIGDLNRFEAKMEEYLNADWWFRLGVELNIAIPIGSTLIKNSRRIKFIKRQ